MDGLSRRSLLKGTLIEGLSAGRLGTVLGAVSALSLPRFVSLDDIPLRPCTFLQWTGYPCPLCGTTRSFWAMASGDWSWAFFNSPLGALLYVAVLVCALLSIAFFIGELLKGRKVQVSLMPRSSRRLTIVLVAALSANWIYRLVMGLK